jgi:CDP-diacylglycerol--serine O-phosphatidyltransferase
MMLTRAVVPTLFTVLNMFCGFLSIISAADGKYVEASYLILLAGVFDSLDGIMARLTKSSSEFGVEIDSLSDVVSFGAAPAFLVYQLHLNHLEVWGVIISSMLMILGGIRLARFNVQLVGFDKNHFNGLPIPASAFIIVSYVLTFIVDGARLEGMAASFLPFLVVATSLIMVSTIKYDTLPSLNAKEIKKHPVKMISYFFAALIVLFTKGTAIFYLISLFVLHGIVRHVVHLIRRSDKTEPDLDEAPNYDI